jgi:hypothetical protein
MNINLKNYESPMEATYHPEVDDTPTLDDDETSKYRMLVGSVNWTVTLVRFDVYYATQTLARYMVTPREGHKKAMLRVFGYLKHKAKGKIVLDVRKTMGGPGKVDLSAWKEFYHDAKEEIPKDPEPKGKSVSTTIYKDADYASDL